jgi:hypothetical protein
VFTFDLLERTRSLSINQGSRKEFRPIKSVMVSPLLGDRVDLLTHQAIDEQRCQLTLLLRRQ